MERNFIAHIRPICKQTEIIVNNRKKYKYSDPVCYTYCSLSKAERDKNFRISSNGGITIAFIKYGKTLSIGIAKCNNKDTFNKRVGTQIAKGRAEKKLYITDDVDIKDIYVKGKTVKQLHS